jgi:hypothetical protein
MKKSNEERKANFVILTILDVSFSSIHPGLNTSAALYSDPGQSKSLLLSKVKNPYQISSTTIHSNNEKIMKKRFQKRKKKSKFKKNVKEEEKRKKEKK